MKNELIENKENNLVLLDEDYVKGKTYFIRDKKVMLDSDLAEIYGYSTMRFNEQVKNNIDRFDDDFRFQLTDNEYKNLISKKSISSWGARRTLPYAFTEEGIYMLMTVLKGEKAIKQSKMLIRIFKSMKDYIISDTKITQEYINSLVLNDHTTLLKHDNKIDYIDNNIKLLKKSFNKLAEKEFKNRIFFKGQTYDSYSLILDIFNTSKEEIIIIDNYTDKKILDLISKTNKKVLIISKNMNEELIKKYQSQYDNLTIKESNEFHDRFIIIDKKELYHLGSSLKDLGKGSFAINKIEDIDYISMLLNKI